MRTEKADLKVGLYGIGEGAGLYGIGEGAGLYGIGRSSVAADLQVGLT